VWGSSESARVAAGLIVGIFAAIFIAYLVAERPFSFSLVDRECENAQQQYYDARNQATVGKNKNPAAQNQDSTDERNHADVCAQNRMASAAEQGFLVLVFTLVFSGAAAVAAWLTVRTMKRTAERQLRAYVFPVHVRMENFGPGLAPTAKITVRNTGQTPAYKLQVVTGILLMKLPYTGKFPTLTHGKKSSKSALGPGMETNPKPQRSTSLTDAEHSSILSEKTALYVVGRIDYLDAFGEPRFTRLRLEFGKTNALRGDGSLSICPDGNESD
jgi:hypothetical protein